MIKLVGEVEENVVTFDRKELEAAIKVVARFSRAVNDMLQERYSAAFEISAGTDEQVTLWSDRDTVEIDDHWHSENVGTLDYIVNWVNDVAEYGEDLYE